MNATSLACAFAAVGAFFFVDLTYAQNRIDSAFEKFWAAGSQAEAEEAVKDILATDVTFDEALRRLRHGRTYAAEKSGIVVKGGIKYPYAVIVPPAYNPARKYPVLIKLHGGIDRECKGIQSYGNFWIRLLAGAEQISVTPYSCRDTPWWSDGQIFNLGGIVDALKRTFNIDENRVSLVGVSDGGTGTYYIAMKDTTPYASFVSLVGFIMVLRDPGIDDGALFPGNLRNKPFFVVNGGRDRHYPISSVERFVKYLAASGIGIEYYPLPQAEHDFVSYWPDAEGPLEKFVADHPRDPCPDALTWETADLSHNRAYWLVINKLGAQPHDDKDMDDVNEVGAGTRIFSRTKPSGRVDLVRTDNTVEATTKGVAQFTLLLCYDKFDFNRPIKVVVNGRAVFDDLVKRSLGTLLKWAARDNDRTMLYAAELTIRP